MNWFYVSFDSLVLSASSFRLRQYVFGQLRPFAFMGEILTPGAFTRAPAWFVEHRS